MVKLNESGNNLNWLSLETVTKRSGKRYIHVEVTDFNKFMYEDGYRTKHKRVLSKKNHFKINGQTIDASQVLGINYGLE